MKRLASLCLLLATASYAQIVPGPTSVVATVAGLSCLLTATGAACTVNGKPYLNWTPAYSNGADASLSGITWNGNTVSVSLSFHGTVIGWTASTRTAAGITTPLAGGPAKGTFPYPPVAAAPPAMPVVGTLVTVNGKTFCSAANTGFHPSFTTPVNNGQPGFKGAAMLSNEPQANCVCVGCGEGGR